MRKIYENFILVLLLVFFGFSNKAYAGSNMLFFTGNQLYNLCRSDDRLNQSACEGYILAINDAIYSGYLSTHFSLCFPNGVGTSQLRLQLIKFMEKNPENLNYAAEGLVAKSLELSYACGR